MKENFKFPRNGSLRPHSRIEKQAVFDPEEIIPIVPLFCNTCGKQIKTHDIRYLMEFSMCSECVIWWQDERKNYPEKTYEEMEDKFIDYLICRWKISL